VVVVLALPATRRIQGNYAGPCDLGYRRKDSLEKRPRTRTLTSSSSFDVNVKQSAKTENCQQHHGRSGSFAVQKPGEVAFTSTGLSAVGVTKQREKPKDKDPVTWK